MHGWTAGSQTHWECCAGFREGYPPHMRGIMTEDDNREPIRIVSRAGNNGIDTTQAKHPPIEHSYVLIFRTRTLWMIPQIAKQIVSMRCIDVVDTHPSRSAAELPSADSPAHRSRPCFASRDVQFDRRLISRLLSKIIGADLVDRTRASDGFGRKACSRHH